MSSYGGISGNSWRWLWRAFWIGQAILWTYWLTTAIAAVRGGAVDSFHNEYSRMIVGDCSSLLLSFAMLTIESSRVPGRRHFVLFAVLLAGVFVTLMASHQLAT